MKPVLRYGYVPLVGVLAGVAIWLAGREVPHWALALVVAVGIAVSFVAERLLPADPTWNRPRGDRGRDFVHAVVNEGLAGASLAALPLLSSAFTLVALWPEDLPFAVQIVGAVLIFDLGVTLAHWASHRIGVLWRLHAVHHSVRRMYGFNGLMKHPLHQLIETAAGFAVVLAVGIPEGVAAALAACTALQLLLQHSNVDYRVGPLERWLAFNTGHRLHHLRWPGVGDVNFGLFTLIWDRMLGTYTPPGRRVTSDELRIAKQLDYPVAYLPQLAEPFRRTKVLT
jgi:sterol desaturase/sphingolipid hydroxylase (fatty acid hydroxylase superfamily)